jgi:N6-adenosine-specific RNA methylase IME4
MGGPACAAGDLQELVAAGRRFGTIYADPPWQYDNTRTRGAAERHYCTMPVEQIRALPVRELAADEAHLHLWTTVGFLAEGLILLDTWGFQYKSMFVWNKPKLGLGNYWRLCHEILLLGVKGSLPFAKDARDLRSCETLDRGEHSAKPDEVRSFIERSSPGPRLELFARKVTPGWTAWGDEVPVGEEHVICPGENPMTKNPDATYMIEDWPVAKIAVGKRTGRTWATSPAWPKASASAACFNPSPSAWTASSSPAHAAWRP